MSEWERDSAGETAVDLDRLRAASTAGYEADTSIKVEQSSPPMTAASVLEMGQLKPQIIVRIRPSPTAGGSVFEVDPERNTMQIRVEKEDPGYIPPGGRLVEPPGSLYFQANAILENSSQEDTFNKVAMDMVDKGMEGQPGMIVAVGPELSGKSFSLFGLSGRYRNRGILAHVLERMFTLKEERAEEKDYRFGIGIIEIRRDKIRDLLTLSPNEINDVGNRGPRGMYMEEVDCLEHGLGLLMRALIGQKLIHQEPYERFHTIVYLEVLCLSVGSPNQVFFETRLTFAEISSVPLDTQVGAVVGSPSSSDSFCDQPPTRVGSKWNFKVKRSTSLPPKRCCNPGYATGPLAESIAVRRDIFTLEQIFHRAYEMQKARCYFAKLESLGLTMIASERRRLVSGHNFRQSRLAQCLKDIMDIGTSIKILLHVRPDKAYLKASLEAMRFAERARILPSNMDGAVGSMGRLNRTEEQILQEVIADIAPELGSRAAVDTMTMDKMKAIQEQAVAYFENNIDSMKVCSKEKVRKMFENFRVLWNFLWELELNQSLRKAEEEIKLSYVDSPPTKQSPSLETAAAEEETASKKEKKLPKKLKEKKKKKKKNPNDDVDSKRQSGQDRSGNDKNAQGEEEEEGDDEGEDDDLTSQLSKFFTSTSELLRTSFGTEAGYTPPRPSRNPPSVPNPTPVSALHPPLDPERKLSNSSFHLRFGKSSSATNLGAKGPVYRGGFSDFKLRRRFKNQPNMSEDERTAYEIKEEQIISDNFEEMKKVARRQAIHLLRTGMKRPEWNS